jgi:hypothetical protein
MEKIHEKAYSIQSHTIENLDENSLSNYVNWLKFRLRTIYYDLKQKSSTNKSEFDKLVRYKNYILIELHKILSLKLELSPLKR